MRELSVLAVEAAVTELLTASAYRLPADYLAALREARVREPSEVGRAVLDTLLENAAYAEEEQIATCQDTGMAVLYLQIGQDVHFIEGDLNQALERAVRTAYANLRKSVVGDPLRRENTRDNTPPLVHYELAPGAEVCIHALMKGFGAEMMSRLRMLPPAEGVDGVRDFVLETVERAGPNACPPVIVGVGLGSSFDGVAWLTKKALLRPLGEPHPQPHLAELEAELLAAINALGIGPQGLGGRFTALAVHIEAAPTHIAALPVAVNFNCSAPRRASVTL